MAECTTFGNQRKVHSYSVNSMSCAPKEMLLVTAFSVVTVPGIVVCVGQVRKVR